MLGLGTLVGSGMNSNNSGWFYKLSSNVGQYIDRTLYPSGNPLQSGEFADPGYWT
jgi:hypothetical protein